MELWQFGCLGAFILVVGLFFYLIITRRRQLRIDKKFIALMMERNGWQSVETPIVDVHEWVKTELKAEPSGYSVFGSVAQEQVFGSTKIRNKLTFNQIWNKHDGDKNYFILDIQDEYSTFTTKGNSYSNHNFTVIGLHSPQISLPFFTLFPKIKIPKYNGWRIAVTHTHDLILSDGIDLAQKKISDEMDDWANNRLKLSSILPEEPLRQIDPPMTFGSRLFNERFELYGKENERLRQFFDNEKLTAFESLPQTFVDGGGELVFVYIPEHKPKVEDFEKFINDGIAIINAVCREPNRVGNIV